MKKTRTFFLLSALFPLACGPIIDDPDLSSEQALSEARQSLLSLDSSALMELGRAQLPAKRLEREAFSAARVRQGLLQSDETFQRQALHGTREAHEGATWRFELDAARGKVLALRKTPPSEVASSAQDEVALERRAAARMSAWGIPSGELGRGHQTKVMKQDMERDSAAGAARVQSHKTFFFRTLNGVRVEGHRAVVSHGLAASGHRLNTSLSKAAVEMRARELLAREGISGGLARLYWQYTPTELPSGETVLTLQAVVRVSSEALGEPRVYTLDVDAEG
jgi:hypothetical protein